MDIAILHGVCAALVGFAFAGIMAEMDGPWSYYFDGIARLHKWLYKPLGGCAMCFSGQLGLWSALMVYGLSINVIIAASTAIVFSFMLNETVQWLRK